ncbi:hypothetical protein IKE80_00955 [Candidatus Saccharibacteria bacterium]|nr:hypothetical protein [Candidatus Saccharibacteria bacterium]
MEMQSLVNEANLIPLHDMMFDTHVPGDDEEFWHTIYNNIAKIAPELASHIRSKKLKSYAGRKSHVLCCDIIYANLDPIITRSVFVLQHCSLQSLQEHESLILQYIGKLRLCNEVKAYIWQKIFEPDITFGSMKPNIITLSEDGQKYPWLRQVSISPFVSERDIENLYGKIKTSNSSRSVKIEQLWKIPARCIFQYENTCSIASDKTFKRYYYAKKGIGNTRNNTIADMLLEFVEEDVVRCFPQRDPIVLATSDDEDVFEDLHITKEDVIEERSRLNKDLRNDAFDRAFETLIKNVDALSGRQFNLLYDSELGIYKAVKQ